MGAILGVGVGLGVELGVGVNVGVGVAVAVGDGEGVGVGVGLDAAAQYLPPVPPTRNPPQTIISLPVQIAVCNSRAVGALVTLVAIQLSVLGLYRPPVLK